MKAIAVVIGVFFFVVLPQTVRAEDRACLIDGKFLLMGQTIYSKDCMQSDPKEAEATFKSSCQGLANMSAQMGGTPGKIAYMKQCPKPAQGVCKGVLKSKRDAYYYARTASDLGTLPAGCSQGGGVWNRGG